MRKLALIISLGMALATSVGADTVQLRENAPDHHVVVKGDTLWDISAKFLKSPWLWPDLWQNNKDRIRNPHLIYPGDVVYLIMTPDGPRLTTSETVKLSPNVHESPLAPQASAIPTIPHAAVKAFLEHPLVASTESLAQSPKLIASEDGRVMLTLGDRVYADQIGADIAAWSIVRLGKPLNAPETGEEIAREVEYIGEAKTVAAGRPATLEITRVAREVQMDDRLIPVASDSVLDFIPRAPERTVTGRIISAYGASQASARHATVVIDKGYKDGLAPGHVLSIFRAGRTIGPAARKNLFATFPPKAGYLDGAIERERLVETDGRTRWRYLDYKCLKPGVDLSADTFYDPAKVMTDDCAAEGKEARKWAYMDIGCLKPGKQVTHDQFFNPKDVYDLHCRTESEDQNIKLPDVETGHLMIYRVFDRVAYGLVMDSQRPIYLLDSVRNP